MIIEWCDERYATGIEEIDEQHKELFRQLNRLTETLERNPKSKAEAGNFLYFLEDYVKSHFHCEEDIMQQRRCAACPRNKKEHGHFLRSFQEIRLTFDREGISPAFVQRIHREVVDWIQNHIANTDIALRSVTT
jgi:hemerythrin-like metal-binding protein